MAMSPLIAPSVVAAAALVLTACGSSNSDRSAEVVPVDTSLTTPPDTPAPVQEFPDIVDASATLSNGSWTFLVTVSSPYDTSERYADGWRILGPDGTEYGFRLLTHDHATEQPFTRSLDGIEIPDGVTVLTIEGRDSTNGFGGTTFELTLPPT